ncbi:scabin-related ADP-ribosyltransferase [Nonomuraea diastatica]|uniref:Tox-PL domain-containing protein n=1 Tax=Nonomuraea diastatica TaxID=1848329 RepID=A0A4R4X404_9ACTN|nr:hypothetical protein [Nonomuraea diastatica]TDD24945.1 hypothetical protein E1294_04485 [Nonomuraea diastatica]
MEFPAWAEWAAGWLGGCKWPDVDIEAMRRLGDAWLRAADDVKALLPDLDEALGKVRSHNKGDSSEAFSAHASELRESAGRLEQLCRAMGTQFKDAATEIEYAQMMILATLAVVVVSIVRLVTALWTGGITAGAVAARLAQQRMRITLIYRQLLQAMLRYAAVDFATGAGLSMAVQGIQAFQGNRGRIDLGKAAIEGFQEAMESVVQSLTQGALNRRGAPDATGIADASRMLLLRSAGQSAFSGATGGAAAAAVMGFITGQPVSLEDLARAGASQSVIGTATDIRELITPFEAGSTSAAPVSGLPGAADPTTAPVPGVADSAPAADASLPPAGSPTVGTNPTPVPSAGSTPAPSDPPAAASSSTSASPASGLAGHEDGEPLPAAPSRALPDSGAPSTPAAPASPSGDDAGLTSEDVVPSTADLMSALGGSYVPATGHAASSPDPSWSAPAGSSGSSPSQVRSPEPAPVSSPPVAQDGSPHGSTPGPAASPSASGASASPPAPGPAASPSVSGASASPSASGSAVPPSASAQAATAANSAPGGGAVPIAARDTGSGAHGRRETPAPAPSGDGGAVSKQAGPETHEGEAREAERLAERLRAAGLRVDLGGIHPEAARASAAVVQRLAEGYPVAALRHFRVVNFDEEFGHLPGAETQPAVAVTNGKRRGVYLNQRHFADHAGMVERGARDEETGRTVPGGGTVEGIVYHEYGHQLAEGMLDDPAIRAELDQVVSRALRMPYDAEGFHDDPAIRTEVEWHLSTIGASDPHEMIAEAFTEYHNAERPRPLATAIGRVIDRHMSRDTASRPRPPADGFPRTREPEEVHARDAFSSPENDADDFWVDVALEAFRIGEDRAAAAQQNQWVRWEECRVLERELVLAAGLDDMTVWQEFKQNGRAIPPDHRQWREIRKGHDYVYGALKSHFGRTHEELYPEGEGAAAGIRTTVDDDHAGHDAGPAVAEPRASGARSAGGGDPTSSDVVPWVKRAEEEAEAAARRGEFVPPLNDPSLPNSERIVQRQIHRIIRHIEDRLTDVIDTVWTAGMEHVKKHRPDLHRSDIHFAGPAREAAMKYAREALTEWFAGNGAGMFDEHHGFRVRGGVHYDRRGREVDLSADGRLPLHKRIGAVSADIVIERTAWEARRGERWIPAHIFDLTVRTENDLKQRGRVKDRLGLGLFPRGISPTGYAPPNEYAAGRVDPPKTDAQWDALSNYVIDNLRHHVDDVVMRTTREPLYRVDNRSPELLKDTGFLAKDIHDADLYQHLGAGNGAFVSTSRSPVMPWRGKYQYELDLSGGIDADRTVGSELYGGRQQEVAVPGGFPYKHVRRYRVMLNQEDVGNGLAEPEYGPWCDNPDYEPP